MAISFKSMMGNVDLANFEEEVIDPKDDMEKQRAYFLDIDKEFSTT